MAYYETWKRIRSYREGEEPTLFSPTGLVGGRLPNRIVRDGINSSSRINNLSPGAEILYRRLMSVADDFGRFYASPATVRGACWPTNPEKVTERQVSKWLSECCQGSRPLIITYEVKGCKYLELQDFGQQTRSKSKFPSQSDGKLISDCEQNDSTRRSSESYAESKSDNTSPQTEEVWPSVALLVKLYNEKAADEMPFLKTLSPARRKKAAQYLAAFPKREFWEQVFANTHHSRFLRGLAQNGAGHENFKASLDWVLSKGKDGVENCVKVFEGKYQD